MKVQLGALFNPIFLEVLLNNTVHPITEECGTWRLLHGKGQKTADVLVCLSMLPKLKGNKEEKQPRTIQCGTI